MIFPDTTRIASDTFIINKGLGIQRMKTKFQRDSKRVQTSDEIFVVLYQTER